MKNDGVHAVIELRITPQRDCGFGKIAACSRQRLTCVWKSEFKGEFPPF